MAELLEIYRLQLSLVPGQRHLRLHVLVRCRPSVRLWEGDFALFLLLHFLLILLFGRLLSIAACSSLLPLFRLALYFLCSLLFLLLLLVLCNSCRLSLFLPVVPLFTEAG